MASIEVRPEKEVTPEYVAAEANAIWKAYRGRIRHHRDDMETLASLVGEVCKEHPEFCGAYPITIQYMFYLGQYNANVFERWLQRIKVKPWQSENDFFEAQSDYIAALYRLANPRASAKEIRHYRTNTLSMLKAEYEQFKAAAKLAEQKIDEREVRFREQNKRELVEFAKTDGAMDSAERCTVIAPPDDVALVTSHDVALVTSDDVAQPTPSIDATNIRMPSITAADLL